MTSKTIRADLSQPPGNEFNKYVLPGSGIVPNGSSWSFVLDSGIEKRYVDAQIDDYQGKPRGKFPWQAPVTMTVRARFSHSAGSLLGTAGFGFWNDPFAMTGARVPAPPRAVWFFYASPDSNMKLALDTPGNGWKAATIDVLRIPFFLLAPTAPLAIPLMNIKPIYRALWPVGQRAIGVSEAGISAEMTDWHTYRLEWGTRGSKFWVDDALILDAPTTPKGRLGFVMWMDNQAMTVTPQGRFGWKMLDVERAQWMEIERLEISAT